MPLVRSEGGEDVSNFNNLPRSAKSEVHFPPIFKPKTKSGAAPFSVRRASSSPLR